MEGGRPGGGRAPLDAGFRGFGLTRGLCSTSPLRTELAARGPGGGRGSAGLDWPRRGGGGGGVRRRWKKVLVAAREAVAAAAGADMARYVPRVLPSRRAGLALSPPPAARAFRAGATVPRPRAPRPGARAHSWLL